MKILAFETASPSGGVALLVDDAVVGEMRINHAQSHSKHCLAFAETLLETAKLKWSDLDAVAASHGPGSFTGVRIGLTLAKGIAFSAGLRCITVSTLEMLARHAWAGESVERIYAVLDARVNEVYAAAFRVENGTLVRDSEDRCLAPDVLAAEISGPTLIAGEGARRYRDVFIARPGVMLARPDRILASPAATALLAGEAAARGEFRTPGEISALYLREAIIARPATRP